MELFDRESVGRKRILELFFNAFFTSLFMAFHIFSTSFEFDNKTLKEEYVNKKLNSWEMIKLKCENIN